MKSTALKYYVYISKSKVDMLFHQIPKNIQSKLEKELAIDLKLIKMTFAEKTEEENLYSKLNFVTSYLEEFVGIGDVFNPKEYFKGNLYLEWAEIHEGVVYWGGKINDTAIGLGGSKSNTIGFESEGITHGISHTPWLVSLLSKEIETITQPNRVISYGIQEGEDEFESRIMSSTHYWAEKLSLRSHKKFEFIAKKLRYGDYYGYHVLFGTPIYMAITEK